MVDTGHGFGRSLGDCRPALPKVPKYQMAKTQTEKHWKSCNQSKVEIRVNEKKTELFHPSVVIGTRVFRTLGKSQKKSVAIFWIFREKFLAKNTVRR